MRAEHKKGGIIWKKEKYGNLVQISRDLHSADEERLWGLGFSDGMLAVERQLWLNVDTTRENILGPSLLKYF